MRLYESRLTRPDGVNITYAYTRATHFTKTLVLSLPLSLPYSCVEEWMDELHRNGFNLLVFLSRPESSSGGYDPRTIFVEDHALDLLEVVRKEGLKNCTVIGWSTGGQIALQAALMDDRNSIGHVIVLATSLVSVAITNGIKLASKSAGMKALADAIWDNEGACEKLFPLVYEAHLNFLEDKEKDMIKPADALFRRFKADLSYFKNYFLLMHNLMGDQTLENNIHNIRHQVSVLLAEYDEFLSPEHAMLLFSSLECENSITVLPTNHTGLISNKDCIKHMLSLVRA